MFWKILPRFIFSALLLVKSGIAQGVSYTCPSGWTINDNQCYLFVGQSKTHNQARDACRAVGGDLLSIWTSTEFLFVRDFVRVRIASPSLLGWTALKRVGQGWEWVDGSLQKAVYWLMPPQSTYSHEMCGGILGSNSLFYPIRCDQITSVFICKRGAVAAYEVGLPWRSSPGTVNSTGTGIGHQTMFYLSTNVDDILNRLNTTETHNTRNEADCGLLCMRTESCSGFVYRCQQTTGCDKYDCVLAFT